MTIPILDTNPDVINQNVYWRAIAELEHIPRSAWYKFQINYGSVVEALSDTLKGHYFPNIPLKEIQHDTGWAWADTHGDGTEEEWDEREGMKYSAR